MKLYRFIAKEGKALLGTQHGDRLISFAELCEKLGHPNPDFVDQADLLALAANPSRGVHELQQLLEAAEQKGVLKDCTHYDPDTVRILPPIPAPRKFICVGLNYRDHCEEQNLEPPKSPVIFAKFANAIRGHGDVVPRPSVTTKLDFEGELGVIIGRGGKRIPSEQALEYVLGYTVVNDVSARDIQKADGQWLRAKSMDGFAPTGPCVVTTDEIPDPQQLELITTVNGMLMQHSHTSRMIFSVAQLIEFISQGISLEPGDIISTGTPSGVGVWRNPPLFLQPGDVVRIQIEKIGILENVIAEDGGTP
ncbi:MAG: fumarylacetoacetate hydrolase family protein [Candidatus Sumerlaeaceae bacterium]|jgi:acylpyruvate hydrolase